MNLLKKFLFSTFIILLIGEKVSPQDFSCRLPVQVSTLTEFRLTPIGNFGQFRKARPGIPKHLHTGIDIRRPNGNYDNEPVFPLAPGRIISLRDDGPFAQIIIEHQPDHHNQFWSVYEHVAGISVAIGEQVTAGKPLARFMNRKELEKYGWQFDHLHLEILRIKPRTSQPSFELPFYLYQTYNLECYSLEDLTYYYYDPIEFLSNHPQVDKKINAENNQTSRPSQYSNSLGQ